MVTIYIFPKIGAGVDSIDFEKESDAKNVGELIKIQAHNVSCVQLEKPCEYCADGKVTCNQCGGTGGESYVCITCNRTGQVDCVECEGQGTKTIEL